MEPVSLSVVVPTYNRVDRLRRVVESLTTQTTPPSEIIVVSDDSTDGTDEFLTRAAAEHGIIFLKQENTGAAGARNAGVAASTGEIILFIDDDLVPAPDLVAEHIKAHGQAAASAVVIGPMLDPPDHQFAPWTAWEQLMLYKQYESMCGGDFVPSARQFYTANASLRRDLFDAAGGFDPTFRRMEDIELGWRLEDTGATWVYAADAIGWHYAERSFESWIAIGESYGHNEVKFGRDQERESVLETIVDHYGHRKIALRALLQLTIRSEPATRWLVRGAEAAATNKWTSQRKGFVRAALSCAYNTAYYRGVADELGGFDQFRKLMGWTK